MDVERLYLMGEYSVFGESETHSQRDFSELMERLPEIRTEKGRVMQLSVMPRMNYRSVRTTKEGKEKGLIIPQGPELFLQPAKGDRIKGLEEVLRERDGEDIITFSCEEKYALFSMRADDEDYLCRVSTTNQNHIVKPPIAWSNEALFQLLSRMKVESSTGSNILVYEDGDILRMVPVDGFVESIQLPTRPNPLEGMDTIWKYRVTDRSASEYLELANLISENNSRGRPTRESEMEPKMFKDVKLSIEDMMDPVERRDLYEALTTQLEVYEESLGSFKAREVSSTDAKIRIALQLQRLPFEAHMSEDTFLTINYFEGQKRFSSSRRGELYMRVTPSEQLKLLGFYDAVEKGLARVSASSTVNPPFEGGRKYASKLEFASGGNSWMMKDVEIIN